MRSSAVVRSGMPTGKKFMGWWGAMGGLPQKNVVQYSVSEFRQNPLQGALKHHFTQGTARLLHQIPYFLPPIVIGYAVLQWAKGQNELANTKEGRSSTFKGHAQGLYA